MSAMFSASLKMHSARLCAGKENEEISARGWSRSGLVVLALLEFQGLHRIGRVYVIPLAEIYRLVQAAARVGVEVAHLDQRVGWGNIEVWRGGDVAELD